MPYQFPTDFIDRLCDRYFGGSFYANLVSPESWQYAWDMIYDACRVDGPRAAVREARYWAGAFDHD
jgi:hypothetical protein